MVVVEGGVTCGTSMGVYTGLHHRNLEQERVHIQKHASPHDEQRDLGRPNKEKEITKNKKDVPLFSLQL